MLFHTKENKMDNFYRDLKGEPAQGILDLSTTQKYSLGCRFAKNDGRVFRYAKVGATALVAGNLIQSPDLQGAVTTAQTDLAVPAEIAAGSMTITLTSITTAQTKDLFKDGWVAITDGDAAGAMGDMYQIKGHAACAINAALILDLYEPTKRIITAAANKAGVLGNLYNGVVQVPATPTGVIVGVCPTVLPIAGYGWLQTWGIANVLAGGAIAPGLDVVAGTDVGEVDDVQTTTAHEVRIGSAPGVINADDSGFVFLQISP
jgi:hypothetical protein